MVNSLIPHIATHPGEVLKDELDTRDIKQKDFAADIGMQPSMLNEIIKAKRPITTDISLLFEKTLNIAADFWLNYQTQFDIDQARIKEKNIKKLQLIEQWQLFKQYVPVKFFFKFGYLTYDIPEDIQTIKKIYQTDTLEELVNSFASYKSGFLYRKSGKLKVDEVNMFGWSRLVMWLADKEKVSTYDPTKIEELKVKLHSVFVKNKNVSVQSSKIMSEYGIKLVFQEKFEKTPVDGFSFWSGNNPAIGLTLRHKRIDNYAFTLFHELGHICKHLQKDKLTQFLDLEEERQKNYKEDEADLFASNNLIPPQQFKKLGNLNQVTDEKIISFSVKYKINPAIVLGRVCWEMDNYAVKSSIDRSLN